MGNAGTILSGKLMLFSPELKDEYYRIKALHKFGIPIESSALIGNITLTLKPTANVLDLLKKCESILTKNESSEL